MRNWQVFPKPVTYTVAPYNVPCIISLSDINECKDSLIAVNCTQKCINTFGSYECACYDGYQVTSSNDSIQCIGIE